MVECSQPVLPPMRSLSPTLTPFAQPGGWVALEVAEQGGVSRRAGCTLRLQIGPLRTPCTQVGRQEGLLQWCSILVQKAASSLLCTSAPSFAGKRA